jgi:four helix bundle protein
MVSVEDQGYKRLEIYQRAHQLAVEVHVMTLKLPKHEMYEQGSQIRRSSKSVSAQIVEGFGLRKNKNEFLQYLNRAYASATETLEHLDLLYETKSLVDHEMYQDLHGRYQTLCKMLFRFLQSVANEHSRPLYLRDEDRSYEPAEE